MSLYYDDFLAEHADPYHARIRRDCANRDCVVEISAEYRYRLEVAERYLEVKADAGAQWAHMQCADEYGIRPGELSQILRWMGITVPYVPRGPISQAEVQRRADRRREREEQDRVMYERLTAWNRRPDQTDVSHEAWLAMFGD